MLTEVMFSIFVLKGLHDTRCSLLKNVVMSDSVEYTSYASSPEVSHLCFHFQILHLYCHSKFQSNYNLSALSDPSPLLPFQNSVEITIFQHYQILHRYCIPNISRNYNLSPLSGLSQLIFLTAVSMFEHKCCLRLRSYSSIRTELENCYLIFLFENLDPSPLLLLQISVDITIYQHYQVQAIPVQVHLVLKLPWQRFHMTGSGDQTLGAGACEWKDTGEGACEWSNTGEEATPSSGTTAAAPFTYNHIKKLLKPYICRHTRPVALK